MRCGIFVCTDGGYMPATIALLRSVRERCPDATVVLIHWGVPAEQLDIARTMLGAQLEDVPVRRETFGNLAEGIGANLFIKQSRFRYIAERMGAFDVCCMLDADMFLTSDNFSRLFELVHGTRLLIGANEKFKWTFGPNHRGPDGPLFKEPIRALKFTSSVPLIFCPEAWRDVFELYNRLAYNAWEGKKRMGDIFCWNAAVYACGRQNDVVALGMQRTVQVHQTWLRPGMTLWRDGRMWLTEHGDEVYSIHGRPWRPGWEAEQERLLKGICAELGMSADARARHEQLARAGYRAVKTEWERLHG